MVFIQDMIKDVARSRSHHYSPHHMQTVPGPLHPLYLNYPPAGVPSHPPPVKYIYIYIYYDYVLHY